MELKWLEDFICLADCGSFSKASELRNVTQSAFSRRIMALEEWLGATLIDRKSHPISLTDQGVRFVETARQSVRMFYKVKNDFDEQKTNKRRTLSFGIADHLAIHFFPKWLRSFEGEFNNYYFDMLSSIRSGTGFFEALRLQEYDLLVCYQRMINASSLDPNKFESLCLGHESLIPVCKPDIADDPQHHLPGAVDKPIPFISYKSYSSLFKAIDELATLSEVAPIHLEPVIQTSSAQSIRSMALEGYGLAWLPETSIEEDLATGRLVQMGGSEYRIPLEIKMHRYRPNTKPQIEEFWQKLSKLCAHRQFESGEIVQQ